MPVVTSYIDPDLNPKPVWADFLYGSLPNWWSAQGKNFVTANEQHDVVLRGVVHTLQFTDIDNSGKNASADYYVRIKAEEGAEFTGDFGDLTGKAVIQDSASNFILLIKIPYVRLENFVLSGMTGAVSRAVGFLAQSSLNGNYFKCHRLGIHNIEGSTSAEAVFNRLGVDGEIDSCVFNDIRGTGSGDAYGYRSFKNIGVIRGQNNTVANISTSGGNAFGWFGKYGAEPNAFRNNVTGRITSSSGTAVDYSMDDINSPNGIATHNVDEDSTSPGTNTKTITLDSSQITDVNAATFDCHLVSGSSLEDGVNLTDEGTYNADIDGVDRSSDPLVDWSRGADQFSTGATPLTVLRGVLLEGLQSQDVMRGLLGEITLSKKTSHLNLVELIQGRSRLRSSLVENTLKRAPSFQVLSELPVRRKNLQTLIMESVSENRVNFSLAVELSFSRRILEGWLGEIQQQRQMSSIFALEVTGGFRALGIRFLVEIQGTLPVIQEVVSCKNPRMNGVFTVQIKRLMKMNVGYSKESRPQRETVLAGNQRGLGQYYLSQNQFRGRR